MKGVVFIALNDLIERDFGLSVWENLLNEVKPACGGVYISTESYPDSDMPRFVAAIARHTTLSSEDITRFFGRYLFSELNKKFPIFSQRYNDLFTFLVNIEGVIHSEVKKLYHDPSLPALAGHITDASNMCLVYRSPRKLCYLAEGLIYGAANHYQENITVRHDTCLHLGDACCELHIHKDTSVQ